MPRPRVAAVSTTGMPLERSVARVPVSAGPMSVLLITTIAGVFRVGQVGEDGFLEFAPAPRFGNEHAEVGALENAAGAFRAHLTERADVVDPSRIDKQHGAQRQQFHRFLDRVGRGSRNVGYDGDLLAGESVEQGRFSDVPAAEQPDVKADSFGRGDHEDSFAGGEPRRVTFSGETRRSNSSSVIHPEAAAASRTVSPAVCAWRAIC